MVYEIKFSLSNGTSLKGQVQITVWSLLYTNEASAKWDDMAQKLPSASSFKVKQQDISLTSCDTQ